MAIRGPLTYGEGRIPGGRDRLETRMSDVAVYKSLSVEGLDAFFGGSPEELGSNYEYALGLLQQSESLAAIISQLEQEGRGPRDADPTPPDSPLARIPNLDEVVLRGYTLAIQLAVDHGDDNELVPIQTLWVTGASDEFEIHVCDGEQLITVLWLIPDAGEYSEYGSTRARSTSWRVEAGEPVVQTSGPRQSATSAT
jgi:hypothetical protein